MAAKILALNGSLRTDSWNYKLVRAAGAFAEAAGAELTYLHLKEIPLPVFDEDLEASAGMPDNGRRFKDLLLAHDGLLIASPEYNGSISAALKNALDWASRKEGDEAPLACFHNKVAAIMGASPGGLGGLRGLVHLRAILGNLGVLVLAEQHAVGNVFNQFNDDGLLQDLATANRIEKVAHKLVSVCNKLQ